MQAQQGFGRGSNKKINNMYGGQDEEDYSVPDEFLTAGQVIPLRVPLERVEMGRMRYQAVSEGSLSDLELLYEMNTSDLVIRSDIPGVGGGKRSPGPVPGTVRLKGVTAARLELINEIPGSLEGMMTRLQLELDTDAIFEPNLLTRTDNEDTYSMEPSVIKCRKVVVIASVHETGHLRDILLFLKSDKSFSFLDGKGESSTNKNNNPYYYFQRSTSLSSSIGGKSDTSGGGGGESPPLTFLDTLPWWSLYVPWWIYSKRFRKMLQIVILCYSLFSVVWASWQLYRHVQFIHIALEPVVELLREHIKEVMEHMDRLLSHLTHYWTALLSPLTVFSSLLALPFWNSILQLKTSLLLLLSPLSRCLAPAAQCLTLVWRNVRLSPLSSCLGVIWRAVLSSKVAVQSLDISKIQRNYITNLIFSCLRSSLLGLANLIGYSKSKSKQLEAIKQQKKMRGSIVASPAASPAATRSYSASSIPVYYHSPLLRRDCDSD